LLSLSPRPRKSGTTRSISVRARLTRLRLRVLANVRSVHSRSEFQMQDCSVERASLPRQSHSHPSVTGFPWRLRMESGAERAPPCRC
jgi:hypothetical protein